MIEWIRDLLAVGALASIGIGCWMLHPAAALIVVGTVILAGLVCSGPNKGEHDDSQ